MPALVIPQRLEAIRELPLAKPLDEAVWQAWVLKGRAREERGYAARMNAIKWISLATTFGVHVRELVHRERATSRLAARIRHHRTLCVGVLYAITIVAVLAFVARL